jgi:glycosyltransferase involved in cell wall biosynthesis
MVKTMEYMALGKPGVAFDLPETRRTAQDSALYARPNDVEDFADKIDTLLDDEGLRLRMGARGRRIIEDGLTWESNKRKLVEAYERLLSLPARPPARDSTLVAR